jgi:hypothetical protein
MGTAQSFYLLSKALRSQCTEVRSCLTLLGVMTFVHRKRAVIDSEGEVKEWKHLGFYFFVHNKELRESYDTWKIIERMKKTGFQEKQNTDSTIKNVIVLDKRALKK